jgi:hypothetical protein
MADDDLMMTINSDDEGDDVAESDDEQVFGP